MAAERLDGDIAPRFVEACHAATRGNPFLVTELLAALAADGAGGDEAGAARVRELSPATVARAALTRLVRLGPRRPRSPRRWRCSARGPSCARRRRSPRLDPADASAAADRLADAHLFHAHAPARLRPPARAALRLRRHGAVAARRDARAGRPRAASPRGARARPRTSSPPTRPADRWVVEQLEAAAQRAMAQGAPDAAARFLAPRAGRAASARAARPRAAARSARPRRACPTAAARRSTTCARRRRWRRTRSAGCSTASSSARRCSSPAGSTRRPRCSTPSCARCPTSTTRSATCSRACCRWRATPVPRARALVAERGWRFRGDDDGQPGDARRPRVARGALDRGGVQRRTAAQARDLALRALDGGRLLAEQSADSAAFYLAANTLIHVDALDEAIAAYDAAVAEAQRRGSLRGFGMASCWRAYAHFWRGSLADAIADARATLDAVSEADLALGAPQAGSFLVHALTDAGELEAADTALPRGPRRVRPGRRPGRRRPAPLRRRPPAARAGPSRPRAGGADDVRAPPGRVGHPDAADAVARRGGAGARRARPPRRGARARRRGGRGRARLGRGLAPARDRAARSGRRERGRRGGRAAARVGRDPRGDPPRGWSARGRCSSSGRRCAAAGERTAARDPLRERADDRARVRRASRSRRARTTS